MGDGLTSTMMNSHRVRPRLEETSDVGASILEKRKNDLAVLVDLGLEHVAKLPIRSDLQMENRCLRL
jgi:hypothetical protein